VRNGKRITALTEPGRIVLDIARHPAHTAPARSRPRLQRRRQRRGHPTTHTQARYALPPVFARFTKRYPQVRLTLREGSPAQIAAMLRDGSADVGIATESDEEFEELVTLPCAQWTRSVITPQRHPLLGAGPLTLEKIAQYPLITYDFAFTANSPIKRAFDSANIKPNVVLTAVAADVIKAKAWASASSRWPSTRHDHGVRLINADPV
jgi:LysR family cys regulon transcriptional activator